MADEASSLYGTHRGLSGYKQAYLKAGSHKDTSEMRRRLTERIMSQDEQEQKEEKQKMADTEVDTEGWPLVTRTGTDTGLPGTDREDAGKQLSKKRKETKYSRLSPFQRRVRKQQELNGLLQQLKSEVSKVAEQRYNTYT